MSIKRFLNCWGLFLRTGRHRAADESFMVYILTATIYIPVVLMAVLILLFGQALGWWQL